MGIRPALLLRHLRPRRAVAIAREALDQIGALYAIEAALVSKPADQRQHVRHREARPGIEVDPEFGTIR
ncbi:MAG: hypothetical protein JO227_01590 [Acetobacteraceae bacterium]|nr:hypothetical protein [Acetobacteraceae bacterium]